jgi:putative molybdopterin biosynthesis protein
MSEHQLLTVPEVAEYLRIAERTVRDLIKRGQLPGVRIGKEWRIKRVDVEKMVNTETKQ